MTAPSSPFPPAPDPELPDQPHAEGRVMPADLRAFYAVHNGFGPVDGANVWGANHVRPDRNLRTLGELMDPIQQEQGFETEFDFDDLLDFCPDGSGNAQRFRRRDDATSTDLQTVDWDHETRQIPPEEPFFRFLDERLDHFDEE